MDAPQLEHHGLEDADGQSRDARLLDAARGVARRELNYTVEHDPRDAIGRVDVLVDDDAVALRQQLAYLGGRTSAAFGGTIETVVHSEQEGVSLRFGERVGPKVDVLGSPDVEEPLYALLHGTGLAVNITAHHGGDTCDVTSGALREGYELRDIGAAVGLPSRHC